MAAAGVGIGLGTGMNATAAAGVFVLAVVGAALMGGLKAGLVASVLSFVGLNYFFTPPRRTFAVEKTEDLVALVVFLAVSVVVSGLFSSVLAERLRAERRELELGRLYGLAQALLEGAPPEATLKEIAEALVEVFGLQRSEIVIARDGMQSVAVAGGGRTQHPPTALPIGNDLGTVLLYPKDADSLSADTTDHVEAFIAQAALALERARLGDEARRARLDSEASELRAALFSAVTHDLKTPLSSIKAAVTGLLDAESRLGREDVESLLETILAEADRLNRLLGNLLDLARAKTGALRPHAVAADLPEILGAVLGRLRPSLARHQVELAVRNDLPEVAVDLVQIDQVLTNLLENAGSPPRERRFASRQTAGTRPSS